MTTLYILGGFIVIIAAIIFTAIGTLHFTQEFKSKTKDKYIGLTYMFLGITFLASFSYYIAKLVSYT